MWNLSGPAAPALSSPNSPCPFALSLCWAEGGSGVAPAQGVLCRYLAKQFCSRSTGWREVTLWSAPQQDLNVGARFCDTLAFLTCGRWSCTAAAPDQAPSLLPQPHASAAAPGGCTR